MAQRIEILIVMINTSSVKHGGVCQLLQMRFHDDSDASSDYDYRAASSQRHC